MVAKEHPEALTITVRQKDSVEAPFRIKVSEAMRPCGREKTKKCRANIVIYVVYESESSCWQCSPPANSRKVILIALDCGLLYNLSRLL